MMTNAPPNPINSTPAEILEWFREIKDARTIYEFLTECRQKNYAHTLNDYDPLHIIFHALTTNNIHDVKPKKLKAALKTLQDMQPIPVDQIIQLIILGLQVILKIIEAIEKCKKPAARNKALIEFADLLKNMDQPNPFLNLPHIEINGQHLPNFVGLDLSNVNFQYANLKNATFKYVWLKGANLQDVNLQDSVLYRCNLSNTRRDRTDFRWSNLSNSLICEEGAAVSLKSFLQTTYPPDVLLNSHPCADAIEKALSEIATEVEEELKRNFPSPCTKSGIKESIVEAERAFKRHYYHKKVAKNMTNLGNKIDDPQIGLDVMMAAIEDNYFINQPIVKFTNAINSAVSGIHSFFHPHHHRRTPFVGTLSQDVMIPVSSRFEEQLSAQEPELQKKFTR